MFLMEQKNFLMEQKMFLKEQKMFLMEQKVFLMEQKMFLGQIMELNCHMCPCMALYGTIWPCMAG